MATVTELQDQIFAREGFRVSFERVGAPLDVPPYEYAVMAPTTWRISDWKNERLAAYVGMLRGVTILRGDGAPAKRDVRLGYLRDTYYAAAYGSTSPAESTPLGSPVVDLDAERAKRAGRRPPGRDDTDAAKRPARPKPRPKR